jgi:hypothetical protein
MFIHIKWVICLGRGSVTIPLMLVSKQFYSHKLLHSLSIPYLLAVGLFANVVCNALLIAWQRFIRLVSLPENIIVSDTEYCCLLACGDLQSSI